METLNSKLFKPFRAVGGVCSPVPPAFRRLLPDPKTTSVFCTLDNIIVQYSAHRFRLISVSDPLPSVVEAVAADKRFVYAAVGTSIAVMYFARQVDKWFEVGEKVKCMVTLCDLLVAVDVKSSIHVFDPEKGEKLLQMDCPDDFSVSAIIHPATYLNKVLIGSAQGRLRLINVKTGKVIHEFSGKFDSEITSFGQSLAVDYIAVGCRSGKIILYDISADKDVMTYKQDSPVTSIAFRADDVELMVSAGDDGTLNIWDLNSKSLIGTLHTPHNGSITGIYFIAGEPLMISAGVDNSLRMWIFDTGDGMARQLTLLEGHSKPITDVKFYSSYRLVTSSLDGSVRSFSVMSDTYRQKLGTAGIMTRKRAKKIGRDLESIRLEPISEIALSGLSDPIWDGLLCRHERTAVTTTWSTRRQSLGKYRLLHERFVNDPTLVNAYATAVFVTNCTNFALIGYSSGHIDCFNIQSGLHRKTFISHADKVKAHGSAVCGIVVDMLDKQMLSVEESGVIRFWNFADCRLMKELRVPSQVERFCKSVAESLVAVGTKGGSIGVIDVCSKRVVRVIRNAHDAPMTALEFSPDKKWILSADNACLIKVWDLVTNSLIDVIRCEQYCIAASFCPSGEYLATCHYGKRNVFIFVNKGAYEQTALTAIYPNSATRIDSSGGDAGSFHAAPVASESPSDAKSGVVMLAGLSAQSWTSLPNLQIIKERNKPIQPPQKPKSAPFFLPAVPTLEGFQFEQAESNDNIERKKLLLAKRSMLEVQSAFAQDLMKAKADSEYITAFSSLKSISSADFEIRSLPAEALASFLRMLLTMLRNKTNFDVVQSCLAAFLKIHGDDIWNEAGDGAVRELLDESVGSQKELWLALDDVYINNMAMLQWIKCALI